MERAGGQEEVVSLKEEEAWSVKKKSIEVENVMTQKGVNSRGRSYDAQAEEEPTVRTGHPSAVSSTFSGLRSRYAICRLCRNCSARMQQPA